MNFMVILGPLMALLGLAMSAGGGKSKSTTTEDRDDEPLVAEEPEDTVVEEEPVEEEEEDDVVVVPEGETEDTAGLAAVDIRLFAEDDVPQEVIDAALAAEELIESFMSSVDEESEQHNLNIDIELGDIDGEGQTAAITYVSGIRAGELVSDARIVVDRDDVESMIENGTLDEVMEHEIIHSLGFGVTWGPEGLIDDDDNFTGARATEQYEVLTDGEDLPGIPLDGSLGHWEFGEVPNDVMNATVQNDAVITNVTLGSLEDIGIPIDPALFELEDEAVAMEDEDMMV